jgi:ABC-type transport system involved in cytochrome bd biosynthesis fused ATPase/permease subunit
MLAYLINYRSYFWTPKFLAIEVLNELTLLLEIYGYICMSFLVASGETRSLMGYLFSSVVVLNILVFLILLIVDAFLVKLKKRYAKQIAKKLKNPKLS